jgi:branched-chain amino acid transport system permease protein
VEEFVVGYSSSSWRDAVAFGFLIIVLLVRPVGSSATSRRRRCSDATLAPRSVPRADRHRGPRGAADAPRQLPFFVYLASIVGVNVILAVSLNIVNGMTGQFSIGHAGFMAVGAYTAGKLSLLIKDVAIAGLPGALSDQLQFVGTLLAGGIAAALCGFIVGLPSLRLRGDYLAIVTLGFGEIIRVVVQNLEVFGRALGLSGIPQTSSLFAVWFCVFLVVLVARRIVGSTHGRSLWAIREDEVAAEAMG